MVADVCYTGPHHTPPDEYPLSCKMVDEANARLIAAAPQLLEALQMLMPQAPSRGECDEYDRAMWDNAAYVIQKALGEVEE